VAGSGYLGVDVGSVSTNLVLIDDRGVLQEKIYLRTQGDPISAVKEGMRHLEAVAGDIEILGVGTSGIGEDNIGRLAPQFQHHWHNIIGSRSGYETSRFHRTGKGNTIN
jgi:activator of 2-hydroxyglutaryl-CoA dehydratase